MYTVTEPNYAAQIVRVSQLLTLEGADRLHGIPLFGMQALTAKGGVNVGDLGVLFPTECQLSEDFCKKNNLYSSQLLNEDTQVKGYLSDNRRVRAIRLRGHNSNCLFMTLKSLENIGVDISTLKEGDVFNSIGGIEICKKYKIKYQQATSAKNKQRNQQRKCRIEPKLFPEHYETSHYLRNEHLIDDDQELVILNKLHGTSCRISHQICDRSISFWEKALKWLGFKIQEQEYDYFAGSRRVVKDYKRNDWDSLEHYYDQDIYNQVLSKYKTSIPKNCTVYGEIVGWSGQSPIQKNYTYSIPRGEFAFYVYRVVFINEDGYQLELDWDQLKKFCKNNGFNNVQEMEIVKKRDFDYHKFMDKRYNDIGYADCPRLENEDIVDEGIIVRIDDLNSSRAYKIKSPKFLHHETKILDENQDSPE